MLQVRVNATFSVGLQASKAAWLKGQGLTLWSPGVDGWREGCSSGPGELKARSSSSISLFIGYEGQKAQP